MGDVLVFAEHVKGKLPKTTLAAIEAGKQAASRIWWRVPRGGARQGHRRSR